MSEPKQPDIAKPAAAARPPARGAKRDSLGWREQWRAYGRSHKASLFDSLGRLRAQPISTLLTCLVMGIALSLPMGMGLLLDSLEKLGGSWQRAAQISVFLELRLPEQQSAELHTRISGLAHVADAQLISREQALAEFQAQSGLGEALKELPENPLPALIVVTPQEVERAALEALLSELQALPGVEQAQLDLGWVERLAAMLQLGQRFVFGIALLLIAGLLLVVGNTIRLSIEGRRQEIEVIKLVGGTDGYVRRPFLYIGVLYGVGAGVISWALLALGLSWLNDAVVRLAGLYQSDFQLIGVPLEEGFLLLLGAILLGYCGAWLAVGRHLSELEAQVQ
ncbi:permease-like cell division protein FtsX [Atopomonas sediminilitoris]|uniref:permease-like cell division protein FtsX n=1 Tax=Atopomonas sediminilitoris TaxID=2919919 RepID=UPI001F4EA632|nr:permease-like cell division protein FtsX [Atopomonas sediminilitoris]MCJ8170569.1 permease-like cell division protein FtsX [Atopomonas sediminilitoris]